MTEPRGTICDVRWNLGGCNFHEIGYLSIGPAGRLYVERSNGKKIKLPLGFLDICQRSDEFPRSAFMTKKKPKARK